MCSVLGYDAVLNRHVGKYAGIDCATTRSYGTVGRIASKDTSPDGDGTLEPAAYGTSGGAGAGHAAHLAGAMAAHTSLPIIGVPIDSSALQGMDALLSTVQMPPGVPVATMAIGKSGARNAGILAAQILALADTELAEKLEAYKQNMAVKVEEKARKLENSI